MCKLKPLLERWLIDVDSESCETSESGYGVSSSTSNCLVQALRKVSANGNETSGYDSSKAGSSSSSPSATVSTSSSWLISLDNSLGKRRKKRTSIEAGVRLALEKAFQENPKPSSDDIVTLSGQLLMEKEVVGFFGCSLANKKFPIAFFCIQVRIWFCNRRQRQKKITQMLEREFVGNGMNGRSGNLMATIAAGHRRSASESVEVIEAVQKDAETSSLSYALAVAAKQRQSWMSDGLNGSSKEPNESTSEEDGQFNEQ